MSYKRYFGGFAVHNVDRLLWVKSGPSHAIAARVKRQRRRRCRENVFAHVCELSHKCVGFDAHILSWCRCPWKSAPKIDRRHGSARRL